ncbi:helix-turn-helix domain-containing protein [Streptomyces sp. NA02950]|uniref:AraC-like ligand-binding domain-containing protein n=1 Tax=Streptomyces sp. NA02950 TaxID=2742137 RepID=UPI0015920405|nr:helix-turn-helix domain-containing protein [Streptomyces sp. NA02950]QKV91515.1 helix-turn-helix domain-containing protein [Streptomyces sp. NA02950]
MIETVFHGDRLPTAERFPSWRDLAFESHSPHEIHTDHAADFRATLRVLDLKAVQVSAFTCPPLDSARTAKLIRRSDPEIYHLSAPLRGAMRITQGNGSLVVRTGELVLVSSSHPYEGHLHTRQDLVAAAEIMIPRALLPLPAHLVHRTTAVRLPGREGIGALLLPFLTRLSRDTVHYGPLEAQRLGSVALDLAGALIAHHFDAPLPPEPHQRALTVRVQGFIHRHLGDPRLTPERIAAAHHISARSLHRLFQGQGLTVSAFIRRQRLERARRDLADPRLGDRPIHAIAARCGFPRPADFTRAFRAEYGIPPRDYRRTALRSSATTSGPEGATVR